MPYSRKHFRAEQNVPFPAADVFPLLCPKRELDWIPHWDCDIVYSESGLCELDCVFTTSFEAEGPLDVWLVHRYEPDTAVGFVRINALRAIRYEISLEDREDGSCRLVWEQTLTALSDEGRRWLENKSQDDFAAMITTMETLLAHYLRTGSALSKEDVANE